MNEEGIKYSLDGTKEIIEALDSLDDKEILKLIKSTNRVALNKEVIKPLKAAIPYSSRDKKGIKIVADKEFRKTGLYAGPTTDVFWLRFLERGTKVRTTKSGANRGKISARPLIAPVLDNQSEAVIDFFNKDFGDALATVMEKKLKRIKK